ncbi:LacI family DNA-binding transcriptional regulator [Microbacterium sp. A196]|uniref:LacI family DNA-binding transcriptional regulator n=1 Tax=Microbacterium sp. A196 TaxID=3457320 RepID=UPI003FD55C9F
MTAERARLIDVAREARVSKATASRVLNSDPNFSIKPETRASVLAAATALGYVPHSGARALAGVPTRALLMLSPSMDNPSNATIARGANARAMERGYLTLLIEDFGGADLADRALSLAHGGRVDGIIVGSSSGRDALAGRLASGGVRHVFVNRSVAGSTRNVVYDFAAASRVAVQALQEHGHRRIGHIAGPPGIAPSDVRAQTMQQLMDRGDTHLETVSSDFTEEGGYRALPELLAHGVTAVFATSLAQGIGALRWAVAHGVRVPEDLSIIANDDMPVAAFVSPPLTTVRTPLYEMGAAASDALIAQIEDDITRNVTIDARPQLVFRATLAAASVVR